MVMENEQPRLPGQIGDTKITLVEENFTNAGVYVWMLPSGKYFTDGYNNVLNIPSMRDDASKVKELIAAAKYYGQPEGKAVFFPGTARISDEEYSEQVDRMKQGYIPNMNDLGAVIAAKKTLEAHGTYDD
jgi:hypothetical protein